MRSRGRNIAPDAEVMSSMVRTALATHIPANIRQSLRMVDFFDVDLLLSAQRINADGSSQPKKTAKLEAFYHEKLAIAIEEAVDSMARMKIGRELQADKEMPRWCRLQARAKAYLGVEEKGYTPRVKPAHISGGKVRIVAEERAVPQPSQTSSEELNADLDSVQVHQSQRQVHA